MLRLLPIILFLPAVAMADDPDELAKFKAAATHACDAQLDPKVIGEDRSRAVRLCVSATMFSEGLIPWSNFRVCPETSCRITKLSEHEAD
jgi:hypothetical protein